MLTRPTLVAGVLALSLVASTCGTDDGPATVDTPPAAPTTAPATTSPTTPADTTTTPPPDGSGLVLRHDGLAAATFGQPVDSVMAVLTGLLGPPDSEEIQVSAEVDLTVQWDDPFLHLQFTSWDHFGGGGPDPVPEGPIFHYYLTTSDRFATEAGVTAGSTVAQLTVAHPEVVFHGACGSDPPREFLVDPPAGWPQLPIFGLVDGDVEDPETRIVYIGAGRDRTPC